MIRATVEMAPARISVHFNPKQKDWQGESGKVLQSVTNKLKTFRNHPWTEETRAALESAINVILADAQNKGQIWIC